MAQCFETVCIMTLHGHPRPISTPIEKRVWDSYCNLDPILPRFRDIRYPFPILDKILGVPFAVDPCCWGFA